MSADRFEIHDHGSKLTVRDTKYGSEVSMLRVRSYSRELTAMAGAIRQQARDIAELETDVAGLRSSESAFKNDCDQLRADLAAAVAERDSLVAAMALSCDEARNELYECQLAFDWRQRAEQAEARLAAIDAAPAIARIESLPGPRGGAYLYIMGVESPPNVSSGTELIARPTKDQP